MEPVCYPSAATPIGAGSCPENAGWRADDLCNVAEYEMISELLFHQMVLKIDETGWMIGEKTG
jgi:hypothetical protein